MFNEAAAETKIRADVDELTGKMELLNCQLVKVRLTRLCWDFGPSFAVQAVLWTH